MIRNPTESGWYLARRWPTETKDMTPVVVRVALDAEGGVTTVWEIGKRDPSTLADWRLEAKVRRSGKATDLELDRLQREAQADGVMQGREEARREQAEYEAERNRECPLFSVDLMNLENRSAGEPILAIRMTAKQADYVSDRLSDLLCWAQGFKAALDPDNQSRAPMGIETIRTIREAIVMAQSAAEGAELS